MASNNLSAWERMKEKTRAQQAERGIKQALSAAPKQIEAKEEAETFFSSVGQRENSVIGQMMTDSKMAYRAESRNDNSLWKQTEKDRAVFETQTADRLAELRQKLNTQTSIGDFESAITTQNEINRITDTKYKASPIAEKIQKDLQDKMRLQASIGDYEGMAETYASDPLAKGRLGNILSGAVKQSAGTTGSAFAVTTEDMLDGGRKNVRGESMDKLSFDKNKALQYTQGVRDKTMALTQSGAAEIEQAKQGLGTLGRLAVDTAAGLTQLGADIGIGAATGLGAMPVLAVRAFGGAADQAKMDGASVDQQVAYGLASAAVEVFAERLSSYNLILDKAHGKSPFSIDKFLDGVVAGIEDIATTPGGRAIMNRVGSILASGMGEGFEEAISGVAEPFLSSGIYGKEFNMDIKEIGYQVLIGALTGAVTGISGKSTLDYRVSKADEAHGQVIRDTDMTPRIVRNALHTDKNSEAYKMADAIRSRKAPATNEELGKLNRLTLNQLIKEAEAVEQAQSADLGQPVSTKTATVLDTGTSAYVALGMKTKRAEAKAKVVQKLINGEEVSLDGMKSLNLTDAKYREIFTQLTGVQFPEGMTNQDQLINIAKTASEVRNVAPVAEAPIVPMAEPVIAQDTAQPVAQVSDDVGETDIMSRGISDRDSFAQVYKAVRNAQAEDAEIDSEYSKYLENAELAKDEVAVSYKGKPLTRKQFRDAFRAGNPDSTVTDAELNAVFARELERQVAQTRNDAGVGTTKTGGKGLYRDAKNEYQKVDKKTQKLLDEIGKRLGITVVIDSELKIQSGDKKGEAARGHYSHETRTLRINPELGVSAVRTFRHELTHYIQDSKPEVYEKLVNVVKNHKQYDSIRAEVEGRYEGVESDEARIMDEVMAEYAEQMCTDEQFIELLAKTDRNLFEILMDAINEFFEKLKGIDPGLDAEVEQIKKLWADALRAAEKSNAKGRTGKGHYSFSSIASTFFGNENMTAADFESGDYKKTDGYKAYVKQCLDNMSQSRLDYDEKAARKEIEDSIDGIVRVALAMKKAGYDILDSQNTRDVRDSKKRLLFSSLEPNSDYLTSSDISTICDKRKNFAAIYDDIVRAEEAKSVPKGKRFFDNVDNYFYLHKTMADKGLTQPCRQCYVESMRKNLAPMASAFLRLVNETDANNTANDQLYNQKGKTKGTLKTNNAKLRENVLGILSEYEMSASDLTVETLTTADGLAQLKIQAPLVYEAFNSFYGQSKPKMPKAAVPFRFGELTALLTDDHGNIKTSLIDKIESTGGFRLQSYSDFQIQNFVDVLQVIFEAGTLGLTGHAYTKVPAFLMATEGTGLKRNVSIFMYKDGDYWRIDKNDSFPGEIEDIYAIVESDTTGNTSIIAVSQNEDMSAWIMANDKIGYGIPFHKSGLKMGVVRDTVVREDGREIKGYTGTKDHTRQQTEVWAKTSEDHKALTKVSKGINIYEFWDFENADGLSKNELIEKNVKAYIDACTDRGYLPKFREYVMNNSRVLDMTLSYAKELGFVSEDAGISDIAFEYKGYIIPYGYYKFLGDFGMFTPAGEAAPHAVLSLKNYDFDKAVQFFSDAETLRRNEILQQFANDGERQKYRDSGMTAEQLAEVAQQKRNEIVDEVVGGRYAVGDESNVEVQTEAEYNAVRELMVKFDGTVAEGPGIKLTEAVKAKIASAILSGHTYLSLQGKFGEVNVGSKCYQYEVFDDGGIYVTHVVDQKILNQAIMAYRQGGNYERTEFEGNRGTGRNPAGARGSVHDRSFDGDSYLPTHTGNGQLAAGEPGRDRAGHGDEGSGVGSDVSGITYSPDYALLRGRMLEGMDQEEDAEGRNAVGGDDETYLAAVKRGDMETAQKMVDEAARKNGYTPVKRYHQTAGGFTKFSTANPRAGLHDSETPNGIFFKDNDHDIGLEGKTQLQMYLKADNMLHFRNREEANKWYCDNVGGYATLQNEYNAALKPFLDELDEIEKKMFDSATTDDEYGALSEREETIIEEMQEVEDSYRGQLRELLNEHFLNGTSGYDGIELDYDGHRWVNGKRENVHTYIVFDPGQAKSADPVTYDDNGNVIPLSKRFDSSNEDIRYAVDSEGDLTAAMYRAFEAAYQESLKNPPAAPASQADSELLGWVIYNQSVGAAALRFDPYTYLLNEYGAIEQTGKNNHRVADVPKSTTGKDKVTKTTTTVMGAEVTPESRLTTIAQAVVDGELSYEPIKNKLTENRMRRKLISNGWDDSLKDWTQAVHEGKASADLVAMGATLLNNAGNSGMDGKAYVRLMSDYSQLLRNAGQTLQAANILKKMSPEGKLYAIQKQIDQMNESESEPRHNTGLPVSLWMDEVGELLADEIYRRTDVKESRESVKSVADTILDDLYRYAKELVAKESPSSKSKQRTEMERLHDMFHNKDKYEEAWRVAKNRLKDEFGDNPEMYAALENWLNSELTIADKLTNILTGQKDIVMDEALAERYLNAKTEDEREAVMEAILQNLADQIPASWVDKFQAWRYTAMLGNLRTPIRNTLGNTVMGVTALGKRAFAGIVEAGMQKAGILDERTTSLLRDKETLAAAKDDFKTVKDLIAGGGKYQDGKDQMNLQAEIKKRQRVFKNAALEGWRTSTQWIMENDYFGDAAFSRATYADALARYIAANGTTWSQASEELKDKARTVAIREAAEATFRDTNQFSQMVSGIGKVRHKDNKAEKAIHAVVEGTLPFKKTPANILVRATEYSPAGLVNALVQTGAKAVGKSDVSANEIIDNFCKGMTGSAILGLGMLLADLGLLQASAPDDEKEKELWEMQGHQEYAIEFSVGGKQYSYTIDWVSPVSIPLLVGAELYEAMQSKGLTKREMVSVSMAIFDPMLEMSMLQGLNDALSNAQTWGDEAALTKFVGNAIWGYMTQFIPTLLGQAERASVNTRMTTYADKNKDIPDGVQRLIGRASAKIPGIDAAQTYYMDAWGRTQANASNATLNVIEQFLSPGYANTIVESDMEKELLRLKQATGESGVLIASAPKYFNVDKVRKDLTAAEYLTYAKTRGQTAYSLLTEMTGNATYQYLNESQRADAVKKAYDYSNQIAKELVTNGKAKVENWVAEARTNAAESGVDVSTYLTAYAMMKDWTGLKDDKGNTVDNSLSYRKAVEIQKIPNLSNEQQVALAKSLGCGSTVTDLMASNPKIIPGKWEGLKKKYG